MSGYATIKEAARIAGCSPEDLLAMARKNDPFYSGSRGQVALAEWFAKWWRQFGFGGGVHLRRMHYALVSTEGATRADGKPYQNTLECWDYLCGAGKHARYQGLVSVSAFVDRRNPDPRYHGYERYYGKEPSAYVYRPEWSLPEITTALEWTVELPEARVDGYNYESSDQPYTLVLYVEKSTMDDVLLPICGELGVVYVTALGFQSITTVKAVLDHVRKCDRPCRMFYISDFDPAGDLMPQAVARQVEYWREQFAPRCEIKLQPIVLTHEQVEQYRLPPIPCKESDLRSSAFKARHGVAGATELDALEAIRPGELGRIVREALAPYRDEELKERIADAGSLAQEVADEEWTSMTRPFQADMEEVRADAVRVVGDYQARLNALAEDMAEAMEPIRERLDALREQVDQARREYSPDLPERPEAEPDEADEQDWLFDSNRNYMTQLRMYRSRKAGDSNGDEEE